MLYPEHHPLFDEVKNFFAGMYQRKLIKEGFWKNAKFDRAESPEESAEKLVNFRKQLLDMYDVFHRIYGLEHRHQFIFLEHPILRKVVRQQTGGGQVTDTFVVPVLLGSVSRLNDRNIAVSLFAPYLGVDAEVLSREIDNFERFLENIARLYGEINEVMSSQSSMLNPAAPIVGLPGDEVPFIERMATIANIRETLQSGGRGGREEMLVQVAYNSSVVLREFFLAILRRYKDANRLEELYERLRGEESSRATNDNVANGRESENVERENISERADVVDERVFDLARTLFGESASEGRRETSCPSGSLNERITSATERGIDSMIEFIRNSAYLRNLALDVVELLRRDETLTPKKALKKANKKHAVMILASPSLTTFAHEFGHLVQQERGVAVETELDARMMSHTVFFISSPPSFRDAYNSEKIYHRKTTFLPPIGMGEVFVTYDVALERWKSFFKERFVPIVVRLEKVEDPDSLPGEVKGLYGIFRTADLPELAAGIKGMRNEVEKILETLVQSSEEEEQVTESVEL